MKTKMPKASRSCCSVSCRGGKAMDHRGTAPGSRLASTRPRASISPERDSWTPTGSGPLERAPHLQEPRSPQGSDQLAAP